jgi:hypothetical protein
MQKEASEINAYLDSATQSKLFAKIRRALVFSVLSTIMRTFSGTYRPKDIAAVAFTLNFVCSALHSDAIWGDRMRKRLHVGYLLHSVSRQSVLVVADTVAHAVHTRDVGTQSENTLFLLMSTTAFIAGLTIVPASFLHDDQQGSLKDLLMFSFTSRYSQLHIPGLAGSTGLGVLVYGILFTLFNMLDDPSSRHLTDFKKTMYQAIAMIFSHLFLSQIVPGSSTQVLPIAFLVGMYIVSSKMPMSGSVAGFVLWRTAQEVSRWMSRALDDNTVDQLLLFGLLLCVLPLADNRIAAVISVSAVQVVVQMVMQTFQYLGSVSSVLASVCLLLVTDVVLDAKL